MWPFRRRVRAGSGRWVRLLVILVVVAALCAGAFLLLPAGRALVEDTRDKLSGTKPVTPVRVTASASVSGHPAANTTDGLSNRYWAAPGPGASVTYTFGKPFRLVDLLVTNGASDSPQQYATEARALRMDMEITSSDGTVHRKSVTLSDKAGPQTVTTGISDVVGVRLVLRSVTGLTAGRHVALAEVEFFQRS
ncbi:discoidin domain-containing protein [Streptomyces misionensis]|uniref:discoidin domain-containing protein n=1 Tax=Streptomyces misionensis TaxID=67331 RepID=UPI0021BD9F37|nr:discoidin domain-containing protein [Streptomyces misionensis]